VAAFFQDLCSTSCLLAVFPSISLNRALITAIKPQEIKFQEKCLHSPPANSLGNIREFSISVVAALCFSSIRYCCVVDKSSVLVSSWSLLQTTFATAKSVKPPFPSLAKLAITKLGVSSAKCRFFHIQTKKQLGIS